MEQNSSNILEIIVPLKRKLSWNELTMYIKLLTYLQMDVKM